MNASYSPREFSARNTSSRRLTHVFVFLGVLFGLVATTTAWAGDDIDIDEARWSNRSNQLRVDGDEAPDNSTVTLRYGEKDDNGAVIGTTRADGDGDWEFRISGNDLDSIPCDVTAVDDDGEDDDKEVRRAPSDCSNDGGEPPPPPVGACNIDVSPTTIAFNDVTVGNSATLSTTVSNSGDAACNVTLARTGSGDFAVNGNSSFSVAPGNSQNVSVSYTPATADPDTGNLAVNSNDPNTATVNVALTGNGVGQPVQACNIAVSPTSLAFGDIQVGSSTTRNTTVSNSGNVACSVALNLTGSANFTVNGNSSFSVASNGSQTVTVSYNPDQVADDTGTLEVNSDDPDTATVNVALTGAGVDQPVQLPPPVGEVNNNGLLGSDQPGFVVLGANDLGMHCADQDDSIFSVLPPFNVLHAQVIRRGATPVIQTNADVSVVYSAASNPADPVGADSINSTSANFPLGADTPLVYKGNFWTPNPVTGNPQGYETYKPLFFGLLSPGAVTQDLGLPAPETTLLTDCLPAPLGSGAPDGSDCGFAQQAMPGINNPYFANASQGMHFDVDTGFFNDLLGGVNGVNGQPLGSVVTNVNWFRADGIPILPVDDSGRGNAYPLVRVQAIQNGNAVASTDVVLPVAAEADCQLCHADPLDCMDEGLPQEIQTDQCNGIAISPSQISGSTFTNEIIDTAPGGSTEQKLLNAAKINILRLHDAKHPTDLDGTRNIVCASCHYTPALDLAQVGPTGDQVGNISMSRAMHGHHGDLQVGGQLVFPDMPSPENRSPGQQQAVLNETCYQCHPGKRTQCLRGAMGGSGIVCQDCHGNMTQVGNDFTGGGDRVPWASEPKCQSCHTGDALNLNRPADTIVAPDGIRLLQAYPRSEHITNGGDATPIVETASRWAENETLYRLSGNDDGSGKGHGGLMCEGCHGSTHAIWPNANADANDNVAAGQLQGHTGTLIECDTCHTNVNALSPDGSLQSLRGPHGLHTVGDTEFARGDHRRNRNEDECRACHGRNGEGTVLSRMADTRVLECKDSTSFCPNGNSVEFPKGHEVGCTECHDNEL